MSITRRIIDLARSNLNSLLEKAADTADPRRKLADLSDTELEAELARRKASRAAEGRIEDAKRRVNPDRAERERIARERVERVKAERARRAPPPPSSSGGSAGGGQRWSPPPPRNEGPKRPPPNVTRDPDLKKYYERLEVPVGSDFETVKQAYRRLMRKYHPDLHANKSPEKQKAANEVSTALTQAYNELEKVLVKK